MFTDYLVYKKGLDGRDIFSDSSEFEFWEKLLAEYLVPFEVDDKSPYKTLRPYRVVHKNEMNLYGKIELLAYCLMPAHIYMVLREKESGSMTALMRRVTTYYSMAYNRKRKRRGFVFEGAFKAKPIANEKLTLEVTKMVHQIPGTKTVRRFGMVAATSSLRAWEYPYSSIGDYLSGKPRKWITVISADPGKYREYVFEENTQVSEEAELLMSAGGGQG